MTIRARLGVFALLLVLAGLCPSPPAQAAPALQAPPEVSAAGAVLWDPADDAVLFDRAAGLARPMASVTKMMTVLLALEAGAIDQQLTVSRKAVETGRRPGAASLGLYAGQRIPVRSVLAGLILRSGNDGAVAVAEHLAGTEAAFVARMNARARALGLRDTRFADASGLTRDPGHRSSPADLARLAARAMAFGDFAAWAGADRLTVPGLGTLENRNELIGAYPGAIGVKTGYTSAAGRCLAAAATRDGRTLYAVVLGSGDSFADAAALLDYGFSAYRRAEPVVRGEQAAVYRWADADVPLLAGESLARTVPTVANVTWRAVLDPSTSLPVAAGRRLGRAELLVDGAVVESVPLLAAAAVPSPPRPASGAAAVGTAVEDTLREFSRLLPLEPAAA